jgi:hypothetical protein
MKHFTLLAVLCLLAWQGNAQILNQAASWPNATWTVGGSYSAIALVNDPTTSANLSYNDDAAGSGSLSDVVQAASPVINLTPASLAGETWIEVNYAYDYFAGISYALEWYDADAAAWIVWNNLPQNSSTTSNWCISVIANTTPVLDISAFTANQLSGFRYRFNYNATGTWGWGFCTSSPTIYSSMPPSCLDPSALTVAAITSTSADFGWTDNSGSGLANIEYGPTGFTLGTGTQIMGTTNNPELVTGLLPSTGYQFYIQSDCGGGNLSAWFGPFSFITAFNAPSGVSCGAGFASMIFSDDMETAIGWTGNIGTAAGSWDYPTASPGGNSGGTGPSGPASGSTYAEYEASGSQNLASMVTPMIDLTNGTTEAELSFYMHAFGTEIGTLNVGIGNAPGGPFTTEFSWTGQYQTTAAQAWEQIGVDISAYLGQQIYVEFSYAATGPGFSGDMAIDLVQVETCVSCPAPSAFSLVDADFDSGEFAWTENGSATTWELEYGPTGFTPGTGTVQVTIQNPDSIVGLASNSFYDVYITSVCGPTDSSSLVGPLSFNTYNQGMYMEADNQCGPGFTDISGTGVENLLGDDGEVGWTLPFSLLYQGTLVDQLTIGSNGGVLFNTLTGQVAFINGVMSGAADGLYPFWDDLGPEELGEGVYYEVIGTSPNQQAIIQWNKDHLSGNGNTYIFQLIIDQATQEIYYVYDVVDVSSAPYDFGLSATVGLAGPNQDIQLSQNNAQYLTDNTCAHFYYTDCPKPLNFSVSYTTTNEGAITWSAGLSGETNWTVIYGVAGFDPTQTGTTVQTATSVLIMPGLDDITTYDVYIYADCSPSNQSFGTTGSFTTLPNCADPTVFGATTAVDSLMTSWSWTENVGYPSVGFDIEYGWNGFTQGTGTLVGLDNNFTDTTADVSLLGGGVYQVYLQALCSSDSSGWVGPINFIMPLSNDTVCGAEMLAVDGTVYTFDNTGASVTPEEIASVTPPTTGFNGTNLPQLGWGPLSTTIEHSTWFTFVAPASGSMTYSGVDEDFFASQVAIFETNSSCSVLSAMNLVAASDQTDAALAAKIAPNFTICGLTPGQTYYILNDSWSNGGAGILGQYSISLTEIVVSAGTDNGLANICLGDTVNLFTNISGNDAGGVWYENIPTANFSDSIFVSAGLASQEFVFDYVVTNGCANDSVTTSVEIYAPSSAGTDGTIIACLNQPIDLLDGLGGNVDLGGAWYDPTNTLITSTSINSGPIPGQFNYDYIAGNGVCPDDSANIIVDVDPTCDYLSLQDLFFNGMDIHPNPTTGMIYISNDGSTELFNIELTDLNGKVIATESGAVNGTETTEVDLSNLETGIYLIHVFNENAEKIFRVVKQ